MGNGIVRSCHQEGAAYILTVAMTPDPAYVSPRQEFDPGILDLDSFLTEEEEAKILESLKDETPYAVTVHRIFHRFCVRLGNCLVSTAGLLFRPLASL